MTGRAGAHGQAVENASFPLNALPASGWLRTVNVPPISPTSHRTMDSPSPVHPKRRVVELSACVNGSKMRYCCSDEIPMPVSATSISTIDCKSESAEFRAMTAYRKDSDR
jgi:hypothetical protein